MIYNNLIYLLVVILILTTSSVPEAPRVEPGLALLLFLAKGLLYQQLAHRAFRRQSVARASRYFATEQKLSILAILFFAVDVYFLDLQYYLARLPFAAKVESLTALGGLLLFFAYLAVLWLEARPRYEEVFGRRYTPRAFLLSNLKINLPIVLPWLLLSIIYDLLGLVPVPALQRALASPWGEPAVVLLFFLLLAITFPLLIVRLWNCRPLPAGPTRAHIEHICRRDGLTYREIMTWPLFEGRTLTAGIMGLTRRFRYLLITPALIEALDPDEMEAVVAHEIGHVKLYHLPLYLLLFLGFGLLAQLASYPLLSLILGSGLFYRTLQETHLDPGGALGTVSIVAIFLLMLVYFRFVFGFFMRNFERQADLHALTVFQGDAGPLVRVLEKIGWLSGNIRDLPSWHHFGIGQRVDYLLKCQADRRFVRRHHAKVYLSLLLYLAVLGGTGILLWRLPADLLEGATREKFAAAVITHQIEKEPRNPLWHQFLGDLQQSRGRDAEAIAAYEQGLTLAPDQPEILNNLAWLLLTAKEGRFRDPRRALALAEKAAAVKPEGFILDTLAAAYWANGMTDLAVRTEQQAIRADPRNSRYYRDQIEKFHREPLPLH
ncbi:MAG: M48 family metalloprotease, partial [Desulfobacteraceae bacterium]|nr:M48 family metalloprotease [Desulfobacteraceae bacterium]